MKMYLHIPEISPTAGRNSDGVPVGAINQVQLAAARLGVIQATEAWSYRYEQNGGSNHISISVMTDEGSFFPWNATAKFTANSRWILAANKDICAVYVKIKTPGVWTGTGLKVQESVDGINWTDVGNLVDDSNGFRNAAGIYKIDFDLNQANRKSFPLWFGQTAREWLQIIPNGLTGTPTTAPEIERIWAICPESGITYIDILPALSGSMTSNDFSAVPHQTAFSTVGDVIYFGFSGLPIGWDDTVYRATQNRTGVYEYLASDNTWKTFQSVSDPGDQLKNGPATLGTASNSYRNRLSTPADWPEKSLTLPPSAALSTRWMRFRVTSVSPLGVVSSALYRRRARAYGVGNAVGIYHKVAASYSYLTFELGVAPATDMTLSWANANTGDSRSITIPANSRSSSQLVNGRLDFSSPLAIGAGEHLIPAIHISGGSASDCHLSWN